jgi:hypothetical protein
MAWRENKRRVANGELHALVCGAALNHPESQLWKGYWQLYLQRRSIGDKSGANEA